MFCLLAEINILLLLLLIANDDELKRLAMSEQVIVAVTEHWRTQLSVQAVNHRSRLHICSRKPRYVWVSFCGLTPRENAAGSLTIADVVFVRLFWNYCRHLSVLFPIVCFTFSVNFSLVCEFQTSCRCGQALSCRLLSRPR